MNISLHFYLLSAEAIQFSINKQQQYIDKAIRETAVKNHSNSHHTPQTGPLIFHPTLTPLEIHFHSHSSLLKPGCILLDQKSL